MHKSLVDVPVLLIFFARPNTFKMVFDEVKKARPSKLFLYQDGARVGREDDIKNVQICREIAENIDWECEVYKFYQEKNVGCDPSEFIAIKWFFDHVDRGIILEDDDVPSQSFFPFCKELLDKYADDERIHMITGMNHNGTYTNDNNQSDYFFTTAGAIWGWASWKRCIDTWDEHYSFLDNDDALKLLSQSFKNSPFYRSSRSRIDYFIKDCTRHRNSKKAYYETINASSKFLNGRVNIVPTKNLISNIGIDVNNTNYADDIRKVPAKFRKTLIMKTCNYDFPLRHPKYVMNDKNYALLVEKIMCTNIFTRFFIIQEGRIRNLIYSNKTQLKNLFLKKLGLKK